MIKAMCLAFERQAFIFYGVTTPLGHLVLQPG